MFVLFFPNSFWFLWIISRTGDDWISRRKLTAPMLGTLQWTHQDSHLNSRPIQACSRGGIFQPWHAKFFSDPVTSTSWRSDVHGRRVVLVGTEKFRTQLLWIFLRKNEKTKLRKRWNSSRRVWVRVLLEATAVIYCCSLLKLPFSPNKLPPLRLAQMRAHVSQSYRFMVTFLTFYNQQVPELLGFVWLVKSDSY